MPDGTGFYKLKIPALLRKHGTQKKTGIVIIILAQHPQLLNQSHVDKLIKKDANISVFFVFYKINSLTIPTGLQLYIL